MIGTSVALRRMLYVGILALAFLAGACGSGGGTGGEAGALPEIDLDDLSSTEPSGVESGSAETTPADPVDACKASLAPYTQLGSDGANAAAVTLKPYRPSSRVRNPSTTRWFSNARSPRGAALQRLASASMVFAPAAM